MAYYRATIRFGSPQTYEMVDVQADDLREALERVVREFPEGAVDSADLVEVRRMTEPEAREYVPE